VCNDVTVGANDGDGTWEMMKLSKTEYFLLVHGLLLDSLAASCVLDAGTQF